MEGRETEPWEGIPFFGWGADIDVDAMLASDGIVEFADESGDDAEEPGGPGSMEETPGKPERPGGGADERSDAAVDTEGSNAIEASGAAFDSDAALAAAGYRRVDGGQGGFWIRADGTAATPGELREHIHDRILERADREGWTARQFVAELRNAQGDHPEGDRNGSDIEVSKTRSDLRFDGNGASEPPGDEDFAAEVNRIFRGLDGQAKIRTIKDITRRIETDPNILDTLDPLDATLYREAKLEIDKNKHPHNAIDFAETIAIQNHTKGRTIDEVIRERRASAKAENAEQRRKREAREREQREKENVRPKLSGKTRKRKKLSEGEIREAIDNVFEKSGFSAEMSDAEFDRRVSEMRKTRPDGREFPVLDLERARLIRDIMRVTPKTRDALFARLGTDMQGDPHARLMLLKIMEEIKDLPEKDPKRLRLTRLIYQHARTDGIGRRHNLLDKINKAE